jgi:uncharacterized protein
MSLPPIDVRELLGHPGSTRPCEVRGTVSELGIELAEVPSDEPIQADLLLESVVEGVFISGHLRGSWHIRCARCLKETAQAFDIPVQELFADRADPEDDVYAIVPPGSIELEQMVRDAVGLELPFSPLCRADCAGLCPICGGDRNLGECPGHEQIDPRFAVLSGMFPDGPAADD